MALRWTISAKLEAAKGFRCLKAHHQLPILKNPSAAHRAMNTGDAALEEHGAGAYILT